LRSDPAPDFSEYGSGSSQNYTDLPPWQIRIICVASGVIDTADYTKSIS
jgi:hypothetical protein